LNLFLPVIYGSDIEIQAVTDKGKGNGREKNRKGKMTAGKKKT